MKHYEREHDQSEYRAIYALNDHELNEWLDEGKVVTIKAQRASEKAIATSKVNRAKRKAINHGFKTIDDAKAQAHEEWVDLWECHREYHKPNADDDYELDLWLDDYRHKWGWLLVWLA